MKLYGSAVAPNPRRVRIFLAEKGIEVPTVDVDIVKAENRQPPFLAKNPLGGVPILELDDGAIIAESTAICRYFEETKPEPPLMGADARDRAIVDRGMIRVRTEAQNRSVMVWIEDDGCGIEADLIDRIFDPFFTTKPVGEGTGLGLGIAHEIVRKHGGEITIDSKPGRGTVFGVRLPVRADTLEGELN